MKRSELLFSILLIPVDAVALVAAFVLAYYLRGEFGLLPTSNGLSSFASRIQYLPNLELMFPLSTYIHYLWMIIPAMLVIFALLGLYALRSSVPWSRRFAEILVGVSAGECFILFLFLLKRDFFLPRSTVIYSWILAVLFVFLARVAMRLAQRALNKKGIGTIRVAIVGGGETADKAAAAIVKHPSYRVEQRVKALEVHEVIEALKGTNLDEVIVVNERYGNNELIILRNYCLEEGVSFSFVPSLFTELQGSIDVRNLASLPVVEVAPTPLEGWGRVTKRFFDLIVGTLMLIVFSPVLLVIAISVLVTDYGPLIYKHGRIGKYGQPIKVWKFRTMRQEFSTGIGGGGDKKFADLLAGNPEMAVEWKATHKLKNDPRVSPIGKFLRAVSLDELPQLFNVLGGSLSLVGPRPIVTDEITKYGEQSRILFTVKPGLTGLWQVSGRSDTTYEERIRLDTRYIERWNVWTDIAILFKTAWVLARKSGKGAY